MQIAYPPTKRTKKGMKESREQREAMIVKLIEIELAIIISKRAEHFCAICPPRGMSIICRK